MFVTAALLLSAATAPVTSDTIAAARAEGCKVQHYPTPAVRTGTGRILTWCPSRAKTAKRG